MLTKLQKALLDPVWINHTIGDTYSVMHSNGKQDHGWKITYYPLFGTYSGSGVWMEFDEPRVLIEKPIANGIDFREMPMRYIVKQTSVV